MNSSTTLTRSSSLSSTWRTWSPFDPLSNYERSLHNYPWLTIDEDEEHEPLRTPEFRGYSPPPSLRRARHLQPLADASEGPRNEEASVTRQPDLEQGPDKVEPEPLLDHREPGPNLVRTCLSASLP